MCFSHNTLGLISTALDVGGLEHFSPIVGMMTQSGELIFFRGVGQPPIGLDVDNYIPSGNLT